MCGCRSTGSIGTSRVTSDSCGGKVGTLKDSRNRMVTLFNTIKDTLLKEEYKRLRLEIDKLISESSSTGLCPENSVVIAIKEEVDYEFSKHNNFR